ncbi:MAG: DNA topoisomerase VI subunit B [Fibrobacterota bacterium]
MAGKGKNAGKVTAESMAAGQREISISEFFAKNRHLLGFDNPRRSLLTAVKEAVDNSLDACEEADILPELFVGIKELNTDDGIFEITVRDNGPGIIKAQIPKIFGKLLYGSKFHSLKMSRGQQGIGISAAGMYGQLTTGKPVKIISRTSPRKSAHCYEIMINTTKNKPEILKDEPFDWDCVRGTEIKIELEGKYQKGRQSLDEYIKQTIIANPHLTIKAEFPDGSENFSERATTKMPEEARAIKPHPYGVELGVLMKMMKVTKARNISSFLSSEFSRVSIQTAHKICSVADLSPKANPRTLSHEKAGALHKAVKKVKIMNPPTNCISPIGENLLVAGLKQEIEGEFFVSTTRPPAVYRGNPFIIEAAMAYGGGLKSDGLMTLFRFANRAPLQYQQSACGITKAILSIDWKKYGLQQSRGALPSGPVVIMVHIASVWVPFTSESKEAIAHYPDITKELRLALQECGRKMSTFIRKKRRHAEEQSRRTYIQKYLPHVITGLRHIGTIQEKEEDKYMEKLITILERTRAQNA